MLKKNFLPMYLEHLAFPIKRAGWKVTKIHEHLTFEQKRFKEKFILMNQKSRQFKDNIEKSFYKLMNNSNFDYECRNDLHNCEFVPIFDELKEITYINRYFNFFDPKVSKFVTGDLIRQKFEETYNDKLIKLDKKDKCYAIRLNSFRAERMSDLEVADSFDKKN